MENSQSTLDNIISKWKLILITLIGGFLMATLPYLGIKGINLTSQLITPVSQEKNIFDDVLLKLEQKENFFKVNFSQSFIRTTQAGEEYEDVNAYAVVDVETGDVIAQKNFSEKFAIASITKVMTAVVALDLASLDEKFEVTERATKVEPTNMGVIVGQKWSLEELLNALLLTSSNDAAEVIREGVDQKYGEEVFIKAMNEKARILKLKNTSFENPQGYDSQNHFSSAEDLSVLSVYAINNYPEIAEIAKKEYQFFGATKQHKQADLYNWNGLLGVYPGVRGLKIGNTGRAQKTTVVYAEREGKKVLVVLLGAPGVLERDMWAAKLLDLGFNKFNIASANITEEQLKEKYLSWKYF